MTLPVHCRRVSHRSAAPHRAGYTLVEVLVATVLTLVIVGAVATLVGSVTESIAESRVLIESSDRLRAAQFRLQTDLKFFTAVPIPPLDPKDGQGYTEIVEGPGPFWITGRGIRPINTESLDGAGNPLPDTSVGDMDDWIALTVRSYGEPFVGRFSTDARLLANGNWQNIPRNPPSAQSNVAEVIWFLRGTTLHRRMLLVLPTGARIDAPTGPDLRQQQPYPRTTAFYSLFDVSVRQEGGQDDPNAGWEFVPQSLVGNSLSDLTKRENRYAHFPLISVPDPPNQRRRFVGFPHPTFGVGPLWPRFSADPNGAAQGQLSLPTLRECSAANWPGPLRPSATFPPSVPAGVVENDWWVTPYPWQSPPLPAGSPTVDPEVGNMTQFAGPRISDDVILTNVIGFDIQVWDPLAPVFQTASGHLVGPGDGRLSSSGPDTTFRQFFDNWRRATTPATPNGFPAPGTHAAAPVSLGAYVNLYWLRGFPNAQIGNYFAAGRAGVAPGHFAGPGDVRSQLAASDVGNNVTPAVYCTGDTSKESDGVDQDGDGMIDEGTDGVDNGPPYFGGVDDASEMEAPPPYPHPLRSIRIRIRMFEPDSRHVREVSVEQDFIR
ncbi:MAG: type II secretion system protein [Planctomycetia bacterium]|nr:type II secretion system protein [Planctomycetia bacterium]